MTTTRGAFIAFCIGVAYAAGIHAETTGQISRLDAAGEAGRLRVTLTTAQPYDFANTQLLIDTDVDASTGFALGDRGYDVLVEGANVFRFDGDDSSAWAWSSIGQAQRRVEGDTLTLSVDGGLLGSSRVMLLARTLSPDYTDTLDTAPDDGPMTVRIAPVQPGVEARGDADDPSRDIVAVNLAQDAGDLVITVTAAAPSVFGGTLLFFDADGDAATGFQPPADPRFGFELMLSGATLSEHAGAARGDWAWAAVDQAEPAVRGDTLTVRLDPGRLGTDTVRLGVWIMSEDWQSLVDQAPDAGLFEFKLDMDRVTPPALPEPEVMAPPKPNRHLPARRRVADARSFYCYYGSGRVAALSHYDLAILHSPQMAVEDIARLKALGVVTVGYITVGEDDTLRVGDGSGPAGKAGWYFDRDHDGQPDQNPVWKSYFANPTDPAWRADRVAEARRLVEVEGYDGIFLDTIDTVARFPDTEDGMVQLVVDLREALPDAPIILNQGYGLLDRLAPLADAFMLESFTATFNFNTQQYQMNTPNSLDWHARKVDKFVRPVLEEHPLKVLVLDYARARDTANIQAAADRAATFGFLFAAAPIYLDDIYRTPIVGRPDPRWLQKQATPEKLSITLPESANGFPMNTVILPSGCFGGYTVAPVVDGIERREALHWSESAWASAGDDEPAWIEFRFDAPFAGGTLEITWADDAGVTHVSQDYRVEARRDGAWVTAAHAVGQTEPVSRHRLPDEPYTALRIRQPADGGSTHRPELMWIAQIKRLAD